MLNVNFVPDDYIQSNESKRTNMIYIVLFSVVMVSMVAAFGTIKMRQRSLDQQEKIVDDQLSAKQAQISKVEELQAQRNDMCNTALTTMDLLEVVPKTVILASLTNNLPKGASLVNLEILQKQSKSASKSSKSKYDAKKKETAKVKPVSTEKTIDTYISIDGIATSDLEVASYIENLSKSILLSQVSLVESKELSSKSKDNPFAQKFRHYKLSAMINKSIVVDKDNIEEVTACSWK